MEFAVFADRAAAIEAASADTEIGDLVADLLAAAGDDIEVAARFVQGRVFPAYSERTLDVGPSFCHEAIARAAGPNVDADDVERRLADAGDVGAVAASYDLGGQQGLAAFGDGGGADGLTLGEIAADLERLATTEGAGSREDRLRVLFGLFSRCSPDEARYLARLVLGEMRIGVGAGTVRDAVAAAFLPDAENATERVERALQVSNDYGRVAKVAQDEGVAGLDALHLEVGRPVQAMLAQAGTVTGALEEWGTAGVECKFDGARVQIHHDGTTARVFSRNMEAVTDALPEVSETVEDRLSVPAILDGEVIAVDEDGRPRAFQEVLRRFRRKHDVARAREETPLALRVFDCLHVDGDDLLDAPLRERHDRLADLFGEDAAARRLEAVDDEALAADGVADDRVVVPLYLSEDPADIERVATAALDAGHEGILLKDPASAYTPGRRGKQWLKRKPDVETLDLVVTGAEWGEGRRANLLGTFRLGARTDGGYATVGNVATGITDEELEALTERLEPLIESQRGQTVSIAPSVVFEVGYEEIQRSPNYESGYALRFPRLVGVRDDLAPDDADGLDRVQRLADQQ